MKSTTNKIITACLLAVAIASIAMFLCTGDSQQIIHDLFDKNVSGEDVAQEFVDSGWKGVCLIGLLTLLQMLLPFMPAEPVQVVAGLTYGFWIGLLICVVSVAIGCTIIYLLYKIYGDSLKDYFHANVNIDFEKARKSNRVLLFIFVLFFLPAIPYGLICVFAATVGMKYGRYIFATLLGAIPSVMIGVGLGELATETSWAISLAVFGALLVLLIVLFICREKIFASINNKLTTPYTSQTTVRRHHTFIGSLAFAGLSVHFGLRTKLKVINRAGKITKPAIVLCTHGSFVDFYYAVHALRKYRPHFMAGRLYFYDKTMGRLLRHTGCYPKSMFSADVENVKNTFRLIKWGEMVAMMPEARLSTVGRLEKIQDTTFKFIKKCGVDVYTLKLNGSYLADPKWGNKIRKHALVQAELDKLVTAEQLKQMDENQVEQLVNSQLYYNEFDWLNAHREVHYRTKNLAEGLHNILYRCPVCGEEFTLSTHGNTVTCNRCGYTVQLDDRYNFTDGQFRNFQQWYDWQVGVTESQIDDNYSLISHVELRHASDGNGQTKFAGQGQCTLDKTGLTYVGTEYGEQITKHFDLQNMFCLLFGAGEDFELYEGNEIWYFVPDDKRTCVKWYVVSMLLKHYSVNTEPTSDKQEAK